jgi:hypothetical protein
MPEAPPLLKAGRAKKIKIDGEERFLKTCEKCKKDFYGAKVQARCETCRGKTRRGK